MLQSLFIKLKYAFCTVQSLQSRLRGDCIQVECQQDGNMYYSMPNVGGWNWTRYDQVRWPGLVLASSMDLALGPGPGAYLVWMASIQLLTLPIYQLKFNGVTVVTLQLLYPIYSLTIMSRAYSPKCLCPSQPLHYYVLLRYMSIIVVWKLDLWWGWHLDYYCLWYGNGAILEKTTTFFRAALIKKLAESRCTRILLAEYGDSLPVYCKFVVTANGKHIM